MPDPICRECNREPCGCAESDTPLTDASISWHTAYSGYGSDRISFQMEHVEVSDARAIERELREEIAASRAETRRALNQLDDALERLQAAHERLRAALAAKETT